MLLCSCEKNHPPFITAVLCTPDFRSAGTLFSLQAIASDEDGDSLAYQWTADGGIFTDSTDRDLVRWQSPGDGNGKSFAINVTVSDGKAQTSLFYSIHLSEPLLSSLTGYVFFNKCKVPVEGVNLALASKSTTTDSSGFFRFTDIPVGNYILTATGNEFGKVDVRVKIVQSETTAITIEMLSVTYTSRVFGVVRDESSAPLSGVLVTMLNPDGSESDIQTISESGGYYQLWELPAGQRKIIARKAPTLDYGYRDAILDLNITGNSYPLDIEIQKFNYNGLFVDSRDQQTYKYRVIGSQTWMAENLAYLPEVSPPSAGSEVGQLSYVYGYEGSNPNTAKTLSNYSLYGVLYNWVAAMADCPPGWHLPSDAEWTILENYLGKGAAYYMKATSNWVSHGNGNNSSGFAALPGGQSTMESGFSGLGTMAHFWSATLDPSVGAWCRTMSYDNNEVVRLANTRRSGFSVRCIKD